MVYSAYGITGAEALAAKKGLATQLVYKLKQAYSKMCGFVKMRMSLVIVRSNCLLLCGPQDNEACVRQRPELVDGSVVELLASWQV